MEIERTITFGQLLQIKREKLGLNITEAAKQVGLTPTTLGKLEKKNKILRLTTKQKLMNFYKISEQDLLVVKNDDDDIPAQLNYSSISNLLKERLLQLREWEAKGSIMARIKEESIAELVKAVDALENVLFLDELL